MPTIRLNAFFRDDDGHGWSEQHDVNGGDSITSLTPYLSAFDSFMQGFRRPLLPSDGFYIGCRASYKTANGQIAANNILHDPPMQGTKNIGAVDLGMDAPQIAVKLRMQNAANTASSDIYLRGIWDECVNFGVLDFGSAIGGKWKKQLDAYVQALIDRTYGWTGINPTATSRGQVTTYLVNDNGTVTFTLLATNGVALPAVNMRVQINFSRLNNSHSNLNREFVCVMSAVNQATSVQVIATGDFQSAGHYIIPIRGFIPYAQVGYTKLASRKTGRPFGLTPGRQRAKVLS